MDRSLIVIGHGASAPLYMYILLDLHPFHEIGKGHGSAFATRASSESVHTVIRGGGSLGKVLQWSPKIVIVIDIKQRASFSQSATYVCFAYMFSLYTAASSCPPTLQKIFMLSSTCFFRSGRVTVWPGKAPYVVSKVKGWMAFHMPWILGGGRGITYEVSECV
jgi:hypothetical protein